jgi:hypothetical protein
MLIELSIQNEELNRICNWFFNKTNQFGRKNTLKTTTGNPFTQPILGIPLLFVFFLLPMALFAQKNEMQVIVIHERVGPEIDLAERNQYRLFQDIAGFQSATYVRLSESRIWIKIVSRNAKTGELVTRNFEASEASIDAQRKQIDRIEAKNNEIFVYTHPKLSFFFEFLGKGFYSINTDYRFNRSHAFSVGISFVEEGAYMPNFMYYHLGGRKFRRELGIGMNATVTQTDGVVHILINGVWGYRYQKKNGLLFRFGFTPLIIYGVGGESQLSKFFPSIGLSLGFSF